jgi:mxaJ protein
MSSRARVLRGAALAVAGLTALVGGAVLIAPGSASAPDSLRVCADPNNLPFSSERRDGFENRLADLVARELRKTVEYTWWAQRRGFVRSTLNAGLCDVVMGVPASMDLLLTTRPYYRSTYVFVTRTGEAVVKTFDDPGLRELRIGVQLVGDDFANAPPAHALATRGVVQNVRGYSVYGDYRSEVPTARIVEAVAAGEIDVAVVWGPLAGWLAAGEAVPLTLQPVAPQIDLPFLPMVYDVSIGVRRGEEALLVELDAIVERLRPEIDDLLASYHVPRLDVRTANREDAP